MEKTIYELELHERLVIVEHEPLMISVLRVPKGWIYTTREFVSEDCVTATSVFVPFDPEYNKKKSGFSVTVSPR